MTSDLDIYRAANELIEQHGEEAPIHAAMRADELMETGDMDGRAVWLRIVKAVEELRQREPDDRAVHCRRHCHINRIYCEIALTR